MRYDIRTSELAQNTLYDLTGIEPLVWQLNFYRERDFSLTDDFIVDVIRQNKKHIISQPYTEWEFVYFHITTSANGCESIRKHGILDLKFAYEQEDSELRQFLDEYGIHIDLANQTLTYRNRSYDISYGKCPPQYDRERYACWSIGRKFYYDYTTCGFLSVYNGSAYGGQVHERPEILLDIDELLHTRLCDVWRSTHTAYEVVAQVDGSNVVYHGDDDESEDEKKMAYIVRVNCTQGNGHRYMTKNRLHPRSVDSTKTGTSPCRGQSTNTPNPNLWTLLQFSVL